MVKAAERVVENRVPEMLATTGESTAVVLTVNVAVVDPYGTVTDTGTVALELSEVRLTTAPAGPAALDNVTVPVDVDPPVTDVGDTETLTSCGPGIFQTIPKPP